MGDVEMEKKGEWPERVEFPAVGCQPVLAAGCVMPVTIVLWET